MKKCLAFYVDTKKITIDRVEKVYVYGNPKSIENLEKLNISERKKLFRERLRTIAELYIKRTKLKTNLRIWKMKKLGSYHPSTNTIVLSLYLSMLPYELIEYVILHELMHKFEKKHSRRFYSLISKVYPDYKEHENRLKKLWPEVIKIAMFSGIFDRV